MNTLGDLLVGVILLGIGWVLGRVTEKLRWARAALEKRLEVVREVRSVVDSIPRALEASDLESKFRTEPQFPKALSLRLVRLFGIRRESIPHLDERLTALIDERFVPLFEGGNENAGLRSGVEQQFALVCIDLLRMTDEIESELTTEHRKRVSSKWWRPA